MLKRKRVKIHKRKGSGKSENIGGGGDDSGPWAAMHKK